MKSQTLGPAWQSFGPNIRLAVALFGIGTLLSSLAYDTARQFHDAIAWIIFYFLSLGFGLLLVRHLVFRLWVHESGISYRTIFGEREIRWRDLDRIYYGSFDIHLHYVPLGTFYRLRLITKQGEKLSIGERLHGANDLADLIQSHTLPEMLRKATHEFENGVPLDFGAIRVSRKDGVIYRKWFAWHTILWENFEFRGTTDAHVRVSDFKKWFGANISAEKVANVHVLEALLDRVKKGALLR